MTGVTTSRPAASPRNSLGLAVATAMTTWAALFSWRGFTEVPGRFLAPLFVLGLTVAGTGALARAYRVPTFLVVASQVVVSGAVTSLLLTGSLLPLGPAGAALSAALTDAVDSATRYRAPINAAVPSIAPLLVLSGLALLLLVDLLACTLRRAAASGLVLLTIAAIAVSAIGGGISWWVFVATTVGFLTMLYLQQRHAVASWSAPGGDAAAFGTTTGAVRASAGAIGGLATVLALVLPHVVPTGDLQLFGYGSGNGTGAQITVTNPMVDLRRDLVQGPDVPLVRVTTDDPRPSYLRISVLTRFSANAWSSGDREVPASHVGNGQMPDLVGVDEDVPRREFGYRLATTKDFVSTWLPTQTPIARLVADGDWRYDTSTMDFLAADPTLTTADMRYQMTAVRLRLSAQSLATAVSPAGMVSREYTRLPASMPPLVARYARQVTQDASSPFAKAVALQAWFRRDGGFTYDTTTPAGNGADDLVSFLAEGGDGRIGYCEQFASAMAVMARSLGIPARVAIGFLAPEPVGPRTWEYSAHDLHAWPELFFPGSGWVRFEPTPASRTGGAPGYTRQDVVTTDATGGGAAASDEEALPVRGGRNDAAGMNAPAPTATTGDTGRSTTALVALVVAVGLAIAALVLAVLLVVPRWVRQRRRQQRLTGAAEDAWRELRETAIDLGIAWPDGRSPRETRDRLVRHVAPGRAAGAAPAAVLALDRIVTEVEQERYGRGERDQRDDVSLRPELRPTLGPELEACLAALTEHAPVRAQRRARWWPRSAMPRPRRRSPVRVSPVENRTGGTVEHLT